MYTVDLSDTCVVTSSGRKRQPGYAHHRMDIGVACQCQAEFSQTTPVVSQITHNLSLPVGPKERAWYVQVPGENRVGEIPAIVNVTWHGLLKTRTKIPRTYSDSGSIQESQMTFLMHL